LFTGLAKFGPKDPADQPAPKYDNHAPRAHLAQLTGRRLRAHWAQLNSFEAFPFFAVAVIIAHQMQADQSIVDTLAAAFILFRVAYGLAYVSDKPSQRSLMWLGGILCCVGLFVASA
jgi:uncharacterized MAPEG superfamily protein